jgi:hypothetical protein
MPSIRNKEEDKWKWEVGMGKWEDRKVRRLEN